MAPDAPVPATSPGAPISVFLGTKAQYIKTAPLLRLMDTRGVPYRLIDSGQHAALTVGLRDELGVRAPDHVLASGRDVSSIGHALTWTVRLASRLASPRALRRDVFGGPAWSRGGICVVHGDTPSTLLSTLMARRAGLRVAHLEAGLRSRHLLHPFPEEIIRRVVMRLSHLLFAPDEAAVDNLRRMRVRGEVVPLPGNTVVEALRRDLAGTAGSGGDGGGGPGPAIVTLHRVENLSRRERVEQLVATLERVAHRQPIRFVRHGPTVATLARHGLDRRLRRAGVELAGLAPHGEFAAMLRDAPWVITDGGSIQEECALLGVPTLLWRAATERVDGIGGNVVVSGYRPAVIARFLDEPEALRRAPDATAVTPSEVVLDRLLAEPRRRTA